MTKKTVLILSGGIDSATLAYYLKDKGHDLYPLSFYYGQKHSKEILAAEQIAISLNLTQRFKVIDIRKVGSLLKSSLTSKKEKVPEGHYAAENMKSTVVPNRNMIMLAIAAGYASSIKADWISFAVHGGDHHIYADCRPLFINSLNGALIASFFDDEIKPQILAPFTDMDKTDVVRIGHMLKVPYEKTWSCYKGGEKHCGKCGTCVERKEAFEKSGVPDPTKYES